MIGFIVTMLAALGILYCASAAFKRIESVVKNGTSNEKVVKAFNSAATTTAGAINAVPARAPRYAAAALVPLMAFVVFAGAVTLVSPPQSDFNVTNVAWETRDGGVLGAASDAVLVRTTGADVSNGFMYSKARLSGVEYVSLPGTQWVAVGGEGAADIVGALWVGLLGCLAVGLTVVGIRGGFTLPQPKKTAALSL